jgi:hypothetical protein
MTHIQKTETTLFVTIEPLLRKQGAKTETTLFITIEPLLRKQGAKIPPSQLQP